MLPSRVAAFSSSSSIGGNAAPCVLGGRKPIVRRAELGQSGTWYRVHVGVFATSEQATMLCNSLKDAGGQCIVQKTKRLGSRYRSGRTSDWLKFKNPEAPAVRREAEEDWGRRR